MHTWCLFLVIYLQGLKNVVRNFVQDAQAPLQCSKRWPSEYEAEVLINISRRYAIILSLAWIITWQSRDEE